jgi:signal transduction histidine kinase
MAVTPGYEVRVDEASGSRRILYRGYQLKSRKTDTKKARAEEILRAVTEGTAAVTGGDFFRSLLNHLANAFQVRRAFITECTDQSMKRVRTIALYEKDRFRENIEYDLAGTPCEGVLNEGTCYYPKGLEQLFSRAKDMQSYLGTPLLDTSGRILGHLAVVDDAPMDLGPQDRAVLEIFAARAGVELERKRSEDALQRSEQQLRHLNEQLEDYNRNLEGKIAERTREIERRRQVAEGLREILALLNSNHSLEYILNFITAEASRLLSNGTSAIYRLDAREKQVHLQAINGLAAAHLKQVGFPGELGLALQKGKSITIADILQGSGEEELSNVLTCFRGHCRALLLVPLVVNLEIYGCLALFYAEEHSFSQEEIALAGAFGDQLALIIENAWLRQRARQMAIMEERARLSRELHDSVTQSLYSLTLLAEGWQRLAKDGRMEITAEPLSELGEIAQQALKEMRLLVYELRPPALEKEGLLGALHQRLNSVEMRAGVEARLIVQDIIDLPAALEEGLYRIVQEALNNSLKHASATMVNVRLALENEEVVLEVSDNGTGFDPDAQNSQGGIGLASMRERANQLGGTLNIYPAPRGGTTVQVRLNQAEVVKDEG